MTCASTHVDGNDESETGDLRAAGGKHFFLSRNCSDLLCGGFLVVRLHFTENIHRATTDVELKDES